VYADAGAVRVRGVLLLCAQRRGGTGAADGALGLAAKRGQVQLLDVRVPSAGRAIWNGAGGELRARAWGVAAGGGNVRAGGVRVRDVPDRRVHVVRVREAFPEAEAVFQLRTSEPGAGSGHGDGSRPAGVVRRDTIIQQPLEPNPFPWSPRCWKLSKSNTRSSCI